jgi:hypothetical protein
LNTAQPKPGMHAQIKRHFCHSWLKLNAVRLVFGASETIFLRRVKPRQRLSLNHSKSTIILQRLRIIINMWEPFSANILVTLQSRYRPPNTRLCFVLTSLQEFLPKLKRHLLPRILRILNIEDINEALADFACNGADPDYREDVNSILFKHDRIYQHSLLQINYTTYDV